MIIWAAISLLFVIHDADALLNSETCIVRPRSELKLLSHQQQLVVFRPPSRHTYGFVQDSATYDLPQLELGSLINHVSASAKFDFVPSNKSRHINPHSSVDASSKKSRSHLQNVSRQVQSLYWIKGDLSPEVLSEATSRAILTHATFSIAASYHFTEEEWESAAVESSCQSLIDAKVDLIDITNPNMSCQESTFLLRRLSFLFSTKKLFQKNHSFTSILHHTFQSGDTVHHCIHVGQRIAIGPAGNRGAPGQTLRRTNRGILKQYALNKRVASSNSPDYARSNISTAMEPEIGFLMANLALTGRRISSARVLDPCCGSGSLLLYAAAMGATELVGIDSDPSVWARADEEFEKHHLPCPVFVEGDVFNQTATKEFVTPNSVHAIITDPPYNIGAAVLVGNKDVRPKNHHQHNRLIDKDSQTLINHDGVQDITSYILKLAELVLVDGGRIVLFHPERTKDGSTTIQKYECEQLKLVFETRQYFSPTFSRRLLCLQKVITNEMK